MTLERWQALWGLLWSAAAAIYLVRISEDPTETRTGRLIVKALDSWFFRTRWSAAPETRLRGMAFALVFVAIVMLYAFIFDPEPRYHR